MNTRRKCDRSFKERAVKLSYEHNSVVELASELGISPDRIYSWRNEFAKYGDASFSGHGVERLSDDARRSRNLKSCYALKNLNLANRTKQEQKQFADYALQGDFRL